MTHEELMNRVTIDPAVCAGKPCIRGTRIYIAIILDAVAEGLTPEQIIAHYPSLTLEDVRAALTYAAELARENITEGVGFVNRTHTLGAQGEFMRR